MTEFRVTEQQQQAMAMMKELIMKEESMRHALVDSRACMAAEKVADRVDAYVFDKHPRARYGAGLGAGLLLGLFISK